MRINRKLKRSKTKDDKGYLKSNSQNFTPYKEIDSNKITMEGVDIPLLAIPISEDGSAMGMKFMKPGENYEFGGALKTIEVPTYKKGGKTEWVSNKISKLVKEGYPQKQAIAIAHDMYSKAYGGKVEGYQVGGITSEDLERDRMRFINENRYFDDIDQAINFAEGPPEFGFDNVPDAIKSVEGVGMNEFRLPEPLKRTAQPNGQTSVDSSGVDLQGIEEQVAAADAEKEAAMFQGIDDFTGRTNEVKTQTASTSGAQPKIIDQEEDYQFFNPYAGVDLETAANLFGQAVGPGGSFKDALPSGLKLGVGLARSFTSGLGKATADQFALDEVNRKNREARISKPEYIGQDGGQLTDQDVQNIQQGVGYDFNEDYVRDVFEKVQKPKVKPSYETNLGRYSGLDYFSDPIVQDNTIEIQTSKRFPGNPQTLAQYKKYLMEQNPGYQVNVNYNRRDMLQDGGKPSIEELKKRRTAATIATRIESVKDKEKFLKGFDDQELVQYINQYSQLEPISRQKNNHDLYKEIMSEEGKWSLEPVRYAADQIGSTSKEIMNTIFNTSFEKGGEVNQEDIITGNYETGGDSEEANVEVEVNEYILKPTGELIKVLGDTHEKGGESMRLEEGTKIISDHLKLGGDTAKTFSKEFDLDVKAKDTYAKAIDKFYKKSGLQDLIDEEVEIIKTIKEEKTKMAEKGSDEATHNINLEFLSSKIKDITEAKKPLLEAAKLVFNKAFEMQEASKPKTKKQESFEVGGKVYNSDQIISLGKKYNLDPEKAIKLVKAMQAGGSIEGKGAAIGEGNLIPLGQSRDPETGLYGNITPEQLKTAQTVNSWFDWSSFDPDNSEQVLKFQKEFNKRSTTGAKIKEDGKFGIQTQSVLLPFVEFKGPKLQEESLPPLLLKKIESGVPLTPTETEAVAGKEPQLQGRGVYLTPDQSLLPPSGMIPSTKIDRRYGRMEAERFTPDQQLAELNRNVDAAMRQLDNLPSGQREAALVQLQANKQQATDKIINTVEAANKDVAQKEQAFNIRQGDREVDAGAIDTLSFEQRSLGALANTEDDFRRYFNEGQRRNVEKFKEIESLNLMNSLYENIDITPEGIKNTVGSGITNEDLLNMIRMQQAMTGQGVAPQAQSGGKVARVSRRKNTRRDRALKFQNKGNSKLA